MSNPDGQLQNADKLRRDAEARAEYLRNQQAVAAAPVDSRRWTPLRIATLVVGVVALSLFVATVISYYNSPQQDGPSNVLLPTVTSIAVLLTAWFAILPFLIESRSTGARLRNILIAAVATAVLAVVFIPLFVDLSSLVADLIYNLFGGF